MEGDETVDLMDPKIAQNIVGKSESLCDKPLYVSLSLMMVYCGVKTIASKTGHVTPRIPVSYTHLTLPTIYSV